MNKSCTTCKQDKPIFEFTKKKGGLHGVDSRCKVCKNAYYREKYREDNQYQVERCRAYRAENKEIVKQRAKVRRQTHKAEKLADTVKRRLAKEHRTPKWLTKEQLLEITSFYKMAKELESVFPWKQCVDHIVPLNGKTVSGLHVPWNLQILSASANMEKGNKFDG